MFYLLLSLSLTTLLIIIFREFEKYKISLFQAITLNYWICVSAGILTTPDYFETIFASQYDWIFLALLQGSLFILIFFLIGKATQKIGVGYVAMMTRVSVIFPTMVGIFAFQEKMNAIGWIGIILAIISIILLHTKYFKKPKTEPDTTNIEVRNTKLSTIILYSTLLFLGTGFTDSNFTVFKHVYAKIIPEAAFSITLFGVAAVIGTVSIIVQILTQKIKFEIKNLYAGFILGIPNYFSIFFMILALRTFKASEFFPVFNISVLLLATMLGYQFYNEKLDRNTFFGLGLSIMSIVLIVIAKGN